MAVDFHRLVLHADLALLPDPGADDRMLAHVSNPADVRIAVAEEIVAHIPLSLARVSAEGRRTAGPSPVCTTSPSGSTLPDRLARLLHQRLASV